MNKTTTQVLKLILVLATAFLLIEWFFCGFGFENNNVLQITINSIILGLAIGIFIVLVHLFYLGKKE